MQDLHELPKLRDSLSYLFVEHAIVDRDQSAITLVRKQGRSHVPAAALSLLMLGPGTNITHAAVKLLSENGCSILWTGEDGMRLYAQGLGETRKSFHLLRQAELACNPEMRRQVVLRMYARRFDEPIDPAWTLQQIRGREGSRMRSTYAQAARLWNIPWGGRVYDRSNWNSADPINRALSAANALLNGLCHAAIVSGGYSPAIGFIHTGKMLSFVYDMADLYKTAFTIPVAFELTSQSHLHLEARVRQACRAKFHEVRLLERILNDIDALLEVSPEWGWDGPPDDEDGAAPTPIWDELLDEPGQMAWS